jgi:hypothetical protein
MDLILQLIVALISERAIRMEAASNTSQAIQTKQKETVANKKEFKPTFPGDYDTAPSSVPALPAGVEPFSSICLAPTPTMLTVGYMSTLVGAAALFLGLTRLCKSS